MMLLHCTEERNIPYDPYSALAAAIVKQAADDYRELGRKLNSFLGAEEEKRIDQQMKEISRFFYSDLCCMLTEMDIGPQILEMLDKEVFGE